MIASLSTSSSPSPSPSPSPSISSPRSRKRRSRGKGNKFTPLLILISLISFLSLISLTPPVSGMGVIGIDYGTSFLKTSLVKPGLPFDVVLSRDSKRKMPSVVGWKPSPASRPKAPHERLLGSDALSLSSRYPADVYASLKSLLGATADSKLSQKSKELVGSLFQATQFSSTERGTFSIQRIGDGGDLKDYSIEELVGMQLSHAKDLAEEVAGEKVKMTFPGTNIGTFGGLDVVLTVPSHFGAKERQSLVDAASLSGIRPRLVSDGTAVAISYAITRTFPTPETHLFYDSGSGSTKATVARFSMVSTPGDSLASIGTSKESVLVDILGVGWDIPSNGQALDLIIREMLVEKFIEQHGESKLETPLRQNDRAMARLLSEANRVKHILSANAFAASSVEGLAEDVDFRGKIDREEFERRVEAAGLVEGFARPVEEALRNAGVSMSDLTSLVLTGGGSRVPLVQNSLKVHASVPPSLVAQNLNADEAAVMGAAFYGASFNPQFRMKTIQAKDSHAFEVRIRERGQDGELRKEEVIFPRGSLEVGDAKDGATILREYDGVTEDFGFSLSYSPEDARRLGLEEDETSVDKLGLYDVKIDGIKEALEELKEAGEIDNVYTHVNLTIASRPSGLYIVDGATLTVKPKNEGGIAGALKSWFGGKKAVEEEEIAEDSSDDNSTDSSNSTSKKSKAASEPKDRVVKLAAYTRASQSGLLAPRPLGGEESKASKDKLYLADKATERRALRDTARNELEAYFYHARSLVDDEDDSESKFVKASQKSEREALKKKVLEVGKWFGTDEEEKADLNALKDKKREMEKLIKPIDKRIASASARDSAFKMITAAISSTQEFLDEARTNLTRAMEEGGSSKYSATELDSLKENLEKDIKWFEEGKKLQEKRTLDMDPAIENEECEKRAKKLNDTRKKLSRRKIPKTRPSKKEKKEEEKEEVKEDSKKEEKKDEKRVHEEL